MAKLRKMLGSAESPYILSLMGLIETQSKETAELYDRIASEECAKMEEALRKVSIPDEKNPAKINWYC